MVVSRHLASAERFSEGARAQVVLREATLEFPLSSRYAITLKGANAAVGGALVETASGSHIRALNQVSFSLEQGDRLAVLGHNGAGKSTLLRVVAGVFPLSGGEFFCRGKVGSLLHPSLGLEMELSGYDNILVMGLLRGLGLDTVKSSMPEIASFTGLGSYLDLPVSMYSAGMRMRLSFAVATAWHPEILVIDEGIGTGDAGFAARARRRVEELTDKVEILLMASHSTALLKRFCTKAILLSHGELSAIGPIEEIVALYEAK